MFKKATKKQVKMRVLLEGASGSGKTYSALVLATSLYKKIAVIDSEHGSASLYADKFDFDVLELLPPYSPERYIEAIQAAEAAGYDCIIIDSIYHEWKGEGGCLDIHKKIGGNSFTAWAKVTPRHDKFINAILGSSANIIATCRSKTEYQLEDGGKKVTKQGTSPEQRDGLDFEMTLVFTMNQNNMAEATKDRTGVFIGKPEIITADTGKRLLAWMNDGEKVLTTREQIEACKSLEELQTFWQTLSPTEKTLHTVEKDAQKQKLQ